jgi:hypothetical protein
MIDRCLHAMMALIEHAGLLAYFKGGYGVRFYEGTRDREPVLYVHHFEPAAANLIQMFVYEYLSLTTTRPALAERDGRYGVELPFRAVADHVELLESLSEHVDLFASINRMLRECPGVVMTQMQSGQFMIHARHAAAKVLMTVPGIAALDASHYGISHLFVALRAEPVDLLKETQALEGAIAALIEGAEPMQHRKAGQPNLAAV